MESLRAQLKVEDAETARLRNELQQTQAALSGTRAEVQAGKAQAEALKVGSVDYGKTNVRRNSSDQVGGRLSWQGASLHEVRVQCRAHIVSA